MKKLTKLLSLLLCALCMTATFFAAGCGKEEVSNDDNTLEIYIGNFGYGVDWLNSAIELFKEQEWVKAKYPNLQIPTPAKNSERTYPADRITSGASNTIDLFFSCVSASGSYGTKGPDGKSYFEDISDVYDSEVPGEGVLIKNKMLSSVYSSQDIQNLDGTTSYYAMPWVYGYEGLLYNKSLVDQYMGANYDLPRTTDELNAFASSFRSKNTGKSLVISSAKSGYWGTGIQIWWAQYEGLDGFDRYWQGLNELGERSSEIFSQMGRRRALEALEKLIGAESGNNHREINTMEFTQAQAKFLLGESIIMYNGDWFEYEMKATAAENPNNYDIRFMRFPVISAITEKLSVVKTDADLSLVIKCIDEGKSYEETKALYTSGDLPENDYERIKEARSAVLSNTGHEAYIPSYSTAKGLAKDFLRFLSTDIAINSFATVTGGVSTPFNFDLQAKNPALYNGLSTLQKSRLEIVKNGLLIPNYTNYRLNYYGGLYTFVRTANIESAFTAQNSADRKSAYQIYKDEIDYYTQSGGVNWTSLLNRAGY